MQGNVTRIAGNAGKQSWTTVWNQRAELSTTQTPYILSLFLSF